MQINLPRTAAVRPVAPAPGLGYQGPLQSRVAPPAAVVPAASSFSFSRLFFSTSKRQFPVADHDKAAPGDKGPPDIRPVSITDEMKRSYLDYAMSVIISRALPDVRDGLKPVHRRILFGMHELGLEWNKKYVKSARVVGEVMGKYHPHGNAPIYDALVRMAQNFSMRLTLVDGQGNFGSVDGDPPAAERYTECRLTKVAGSLLDDLDKDTVDFRENYDGSLKEPVVLPAKFPNLLINGSGGIAVGMATNIPPHNLGEVVDACIAHLDNPEITLEELCQLIPGPDFPTGGLILGRVGILGAYHKGRGSILMRAKVHVEEIRKDREALIVTAIPYQVNKRVLIEKIAEQVREKRIEGISDLWDEIQPRGHAHRHRAQARCRGRRGSEPAVALLRSADHLRCQHAGHQRRSTRAAQSQGHDCVLHELPRGGGLPPHQVSAGKSRDRAHVLVGLAVAVANIDEMIRLIRRAPSPAGAREQMMARDWPAQDIGPLVDVDRRPAPQADGRGHHPALRRAGARHPRSAPAAPDRARPRRDRRRAEEARRGNQGVPGDPRPRAPASSTSSRRNWATSRPSSPPRASPRSSRWRARSRTRT